MTDGPERPRPDQPLHGPRRPQITPIIGVVAVLVLIAVLFAVITFARYHT